MLLICLGQTRYIMLLCCIADTGQVENKKTLQETMALRYRHGTASTRAD